MLLIWSNLCFHSSHLDPPDFFRPSSSDVAAEERIPILTLGLLFGERPIDGRFARLTVPSIFGRTDEESGRKENAKVAVGRDTTTERNINMPLYLLNIPTIRFEHLMSKQEERARSGITYVRFRIRTKRRRSPTSPLALPPLFPHSSYRMNRSVEANAPRRPNLCLPAATGIDSHGVARNEAAVSNEHG